jgi:hypothetical protein
MRNQRIFTGDNSVNFAAVRADSILLSLVVILPVTLYWRGIGFYTDDWELLGLLSFSQNESLLGLYQALYTDNTAMRPIQVLYEAMLYWVFGPDPGAYQAVNTVIFLVGILIFYSTLRMFGIARVIGLACTLVYATSPYFSSDRFWFAAHQATISMTFYFLALYTDVRAVRSFTSPWFLLVLGAFALVMGGLSYEVFIPLYLLNPLLVWYWTKEKMQQTYAPRSPRTVLSVILVRNLIIMVGLGAFKAYMTIRLQKHGLTDQFVWFTHLLSMAFTTAVQGPYGLGLPQVITKIVNHYANVSQLILDASLGAIILAYLYRISRSEAEKITQSPGLSLIAVGVVLFVLGYAVFFPSRNAFITVTGIADRLGIAAATGIAVGFAGLACWIAAWLPVRWRGGVFSALIAAYCTSGLLILSTLSSFWVTAYQKQLEILIDIDQQLPRLPPHTTLLLDGICPYIGPAVVFEAYWDITGALRFRRHDRSLRADVVTPRLKVEKSGIVTSIYRYTRHYPYSHSLLVYDFRRKVAQPLPYEATARNYFEGRLAHRKQCPPAKPGRGAQIWDSRVRTGLVRIFTRLRNIVF